MDNWLSRLQYQVHGRAQRAMKMNGIHVIWPASMILHTLRRRRTAVIMALMRRRNVASTSRGSAPAAAKRQMNGMAMIAYDMHCEIACVPAGQR